MAEENAALKAVQIGDILKHYIHSNPVFHITHSLKIGSSQHSFHQQKNASPLSQGGTHTWLDDFLKNFRTSLLLLASAELLDMWAMNSVNDVAKPIDIVCLGDIPGAYTLFACPYLRWGILLNLNKQ